MITIAAESDNIYYLKTRYANGDGSGIGSYRIYSENNVESSCWCGGEIVYPGYSSARGIFYVNYQDIMLNKGTYYLVIDYIYSSNYYYKGSYDIEIDYKPTFSNVSLSKVTAKKKAFNAKWKKTSGVTGYEIQYSLKKNMKNSKKTKIKKASSTSKTIKKLKAKKKFYVRIRTYKTVKVNGKNKTYYGKWSAKKKVTTKK